MKYDVAVICTVEANTIDEARQLVYKAIESANDSGIVPLDYNIEMSMADDSQTDMTNRRVVLLHPNDVAFDYDVEEYNAALEKEDEA